MADYKLLLDGAVLRTADMVCIPPDPNNPAFTYYSAWKDAGGVPDPCDQVDLLGAVPVSVTPRQARLALSGAGLLAQVNAMVRAADEQTQITWNYATEVRRDFPLIVQLGASLGLSTTQMDDLFVMAATL